MFDSIRNLFVGGELVATKKDIERSLFLEVVIWLIIVFTLSFEVSVKEWLYLVPTFLFVVIPIGLLVLLILSVTKTEKLVSLGFDSLGVSKDEVLLEASMQSTASFSIDSFKEDINDFIEFTGISRMVVFLGLMFMGLGVIHVVSVLGDVISYLVDIIRASSSFVMPLSIISRIPIGEFLGVFLIPLLVVIATALLIILILGWLGFRAFKYITVIDPLLNRLDALELVDDVVDSTNDPYEGLDF